MEAKKGNDDSTQHLNNTTMQEQMILISGMGDAGPVSPSAFVHVAYLARSVEAGEYFVM